MVFYISHIATKNQEGKHSIVISKFLSTGIAPQHRFTAVLIAAFGGFGIFYTALRAILYEVLIRCLVIKHIPAFLENKAQ